MSYQHEMAHLPGGRAPGLGRRDGRAARRTGRPRYSSDASGGGSFLGAHHRHRVRLSCRNVHLANTETQQKECNREPEIDKAWADGLRRRHRDRIGSGTKAAGEARGRDGKIHPVVAERLPFSDARRAHELLEESASIGKLALVP